MGRENPVLVLASEDDPRFAMLNGLPHTVCHDFASCVQEAKDGTAILPMVRIAGFAARTACGVSKGTLGPLPGRRVCRQPMFPELVESDVVLTNGSGVFSASLGEFVVAAILYFAKDLRRMIRNQTAHLWEPFDVEEIAGQVVGILGYGDIGRAVASRVKAMGMRVLATKRHFSGVNDSLVEHFYKPEERREMLSICDYVVATAPLTEETRHMISDAEFTVMKPSAVVINVGRGPVIDEVALLRALMAKRIKELGWMFRARTTGAGTSAVRNGECLTVAALRGPHSRLAGSSDALLSRAIWQVPERRTVKERCK